MDLLIFFVKLVSLFPFHNCMADFNQHNQIRYPGNHTSTKWWINSIHKACVNNIISTPLKTLQSRILILIALKYNLNLYDRHLFNEGVKNLTYFIACPPSTRQEKRFQHRFAFTENTLFFRSAHESKDNITLNICDKPVEPDIAYSNRSEMYEIGYEVGVSSSESIRSSNFFKCVFL